MTKITNLFIFVSLFLLTLGCISDKPIVGAYVPQGSPQATVNVTGNITLGNGTIWYNETCIIQTSPGGTGVVEICDV